MLVLLKLLSHYYCSSLLKCVGKKYYIEKVLFGTKKYIVALTLHQTHCMVIGLFFRSFVRSFIGSFFCFFCLFNVEYAWKHAPTYVGKPRLAPPTTRVLVLPQKIPSLPPTGYIYIILILIWQYLLQWLVLAKATMGRRLTPSSRRARRTTPSSRR